MLTREHALAVYDLETGRIHPDRLTRRTHRRYAEYAERMLAIYRDGAGRTRRDLHRSVQRVFQNEPDCPARRIAAFCKLLDDGSVYHRDRRGRAAELRRRVFRMAAARHPLVTERDGLFEAEERTLKEEIAAELGSPWPEIEGALFADVIEFHRLREFSGYPDAAALLARYNVAQVQAALYRATSLHVWASDDFKTILLYARLARLMHTIQRLDDGRFLFCFDGPASVLRRTRRYGVAMARFLPALVACRGWRMHAVVAGRTAAWNWRLELSDADGLRSHMPAPEEFDSSVEQAFAEQWGPTPRDGWTFVREGELLIRGQKVFVPDFVFQHENGRRVLLEIVGFWTPEYLEAKIATLRQFPDAPILLAVAEQLGDRAPELAAGAIPFRTTLAVSDVLERLKQTPGVKD